MWLISLMLFCPLAPPASRCHYRVEAFMSYCVYRHVEEHASPYTEHLFTYRCAYICRDRHGPSQHGRAGAADNIHANTSNARMCKRAASKPDKQDST